MNRLEIYGSSKKKQISQSESAYHKLMPSSVREAVDFTDDMVTTPMTEHCCCHCLFVFGFPKKKFGCKMRRQFEQAFWIGRNVAITLYIKKLHTSSSSWC